MIKIDEEAVAWARRHNHLYGNLTMEDLTVENAQAVADDLLEGYELLTLHLPDFLEIMGHIDWEATLSPLLNQVKVVYAPLLSELVLGRGLRLAEIQQHMIPELSLRSIRRIANNSLYRLLSPDPNPPSHLPIRFGGRPRRIDARHVYYKFGLNIDPDNFFPIEMSEPIWILVQTLSDGIQSIGKDIENPSMNFYQELLMDPKASGTLADFVIDQGDTFLLMPSRLKSLCTNREQLDAIRQAERVYAEFQEMKEGVRSKLAAVLQEGL
jgi:hypothetical protein